MRDLERWKDKVELSLDGRQIFFLFFGSAVAACLIFVAGVLIGKRLEARALALTPPPVEDPLAALDQLGEADDADESLTYHKALTRGSKETAPRMAEPKILGDLRPLDGRPLDVKPAAEIKVEAQKPAPKLAADGKSAADGKLADAKLAADKPAADKPAGDKSADAKLADAKAALKLAVGADGEVVELPRLPKGNDVAGAKPPLPAGKPQVVAAPAKKSDGHFTLQLSAFPERSDAEEFMRKIQSAGYKPFLVVSEIPGKGVFYRVRVGDYSSRDAAANAKIEFERKQRMLAYVAKL
jgi:DedD protein